MRLHFALAALALALLATIALVVCDQVGGAGGSLPPTATDAVARKGLPGPESRPDGDAEVGGKGAAEVPRQRTEISAADSEPAHTSLRGIFVSPTGVWPGGGEAALFKAPALPEGGMLGLFSAGMQASRKKPDKPGQDDKAQARAQQNADLELLVKSGKPVQTVELDGHGGFVFHNPPPGKFLVQVRHHHLRDAKRVEVEVRRGEHIDLGLLKTRIAGSLLVLVSDPDGQPVPGARLKLQRPMDMSKFMKPGSQMDIMGLIREVVPASARTDARGAYLFEALSPEVSWTLEVSCERLVDQVRTLSVLPGRENLVRIELETGAGMDVRVLDPDGKPRHHARLRVTFPDLKKPDHEVGMGMNIGGDAVSKTYHTDTRGLRHISGLAPGRCEVQLQVVGFLHETKKLVLAADTKAELTFKLDPGATITGRVIDEEGAAVPDARVNHIKAQGFSILGMAFSDILDDVQSMKLEHQGMRVDDDGRFVLGGMQPNEAVQLMAVGPGFDAKKTRRLRAGARGVEIKLRRRAELAGVVRTAESDEVVTDFSVKIQKRSFMV
ncbi:MAG: carboxypeptidase-like regulatory domain-containing protein, partial [Planctomycetota bacterium]